MAVGTIDISWTPPSTELQYGIITGYQIRYNIAGTNVTNSDFTVDLNITLTGLLDDTEYQITVAAQNGAGISTVNASVTTSTITPRKLLNMLCVPSLKTYSQLRNCIIIHADQLAAPSIGTQPEVLCETATVNTLGRDSLWQQFINI